MRIISFFICLLFSVQSAAQVVELKKGEIAQFSGVLFDYRSAEEATRSDKLLPLYKDLTSDLEKKNEILSERVNLWMDKSNELAKDAVRAESSSRWTGVLWFGLGVLATVGAGMALRGVK